MLKIPENNILQSEEYFFPNSTYPYQTKSNRKKEEKKISSYQFSQHSETIGISDIGRAANHSFVKEISSFRQVLILIICN